MRHQPRPMVVKYKPTLATTSLAKVYRKLVERTHKHTCANQTCRLIYEDHCTEVERNARCPACQGKRRTWLEPEGRSARDPQICCVRNCDLITDPERLLRYECAGPGPWYQCRSCYRTHGHPCIDQHLLDRPAEVAQPRGTT